jgi:co-chaperonin GroES (HSP10)
MPFIQPTKNRVLVRLDAERHEFGGVEIPEPYREYSCSGVVVATGPTVRDLRVGDRVLIDPFAPRQDIPTADGTTYSLLREVCPDPQERVPIVAVIQPTTQIAVNIEDGSV